MSPDVVLKLTFSLPEGSSRILLHARYKVLNLRTQTVDDGFIIVLDGFETFLEYFLSDFLCLCSSVLYH